MTELFTFFALLLAVVVVSSWAALRHYANRGRAFVLISLLSVCISIGLYAKLGSPQILEQLDARDVELQTLAENIQTLSKIVAEYPDNAEALALLGDAFMKAGQYKSAAKTYKDAIKLSGGRGTYILKYSRALIFAAGGKVTDDARLGLEMVLKLDPENKEAKELLEMGN